MADMKTIIKAVCIKTAIGIILSYALITAIYFGLASLFDEDLIYEFYNIKNLYYLFVYIFCDGVIAYQRQIKELPVNIKELPKTTMRKCDNDIKICLLIMGLSTIISILLEGRVVVGIFWIINLVILFFFVPYLVFCIVLKKEVKLTLNIRS